MPFEIYLDDGEEVVLKELFQRGRMQPFAIAITNRAVFLPMKKRFAVADPWFFRKVPLSDVQTVSLRRFRPTAMWSLAVLMVLVGLAILLTVPKTEWTTPEGVRVTIYPSALVVAGLLFPVVASGRYELAVSLTDGAYMWRSPATLWKTTKVEALEVQKRVLEACRKVGLAVADDRLFA